MNNWTILIVVIGAFVGQGIGQLLIAWAEKIHNKALINEIQKITKKNIELKRAGITLTVTSNDTEGSKS